MPEIPKLTISKSEFIQYIKERIEKGEEIDRNIQSNTLAIDKHRRDILLWNDINNDFFYNSFNVAPNKYTYDYVYLDDKFLNSPSLSLKWFDFQSYIHRKIDILERLIERSENMKEVEIVLKNNSNESRVDISNNKVFIVHGHDELRHQIARVISQLNLEPVILQEQASEGQTIIESFERHSNVGFAIVLLTADDLGRAKNEKKLKDRARQNVILELGYFMGRLGRKRVMTLIADGVEKPSDIHGLLYSKIDEEGAWKLKLARELKAAGFTIDFNKLH